MAAALDYCGTNDGVKDSSVDWIILTSLEHLQKENDKLRFTDPKLKSQSEKQRASITAVNEALIFGSYRAETHTQNLIV